MSAEKVHGFGEGPPRLAKLNHTGLQVVQGTFNETIFLFVVGQEIMPERML